VQVDPVDQDARLAAEALAAQLIAEEEQGASQLGQTRGPVPQQSKSSKNKRNKQKKKQKAKIQNNSRSVESEPEEFLEHDLANNIPLSVVDEVEAHIDTTEQEDQFGEEREEDETEMRLRQLSIDLFHESEQMAENVEQAPPFIENNAQIPIFEDKTARTSAEQLQGPVPHLSNNSADTQDTPPSSINALPKPSTGQSRSECVVCLEEGERLAVVPCGHRILCEPCARKLMDNPNPKCHTCSAPAIMCIRIFEI
jgi:hypothetical protein